MFIISYDGLEGDACGTFPPGLYNSVHHLLYISNFEDVNSCEAVSRPIHHPNHQLFKRAWISDLVTHVFCCRDGSN